MAPRICLLCALDDNPATVTISPGNDFKGHSVWARSSHHSACSARVFELQGMGTNMLSHDCVFFATKFVPLKRVTFTLNAVSGKNPNQTNDFSLYSYTQKKRGE